MKMPELGRKISRVVADPGLIVQKARTLLKLNPPPKPGKGLTLTPTLSGRLTEMSAVNYRRVLVFSDENSFSQAASALVKCDIQWISGNFEDISRGAQLPGSQNFADFDAILVAGPNVATDYRLVLRSLVDEDHVPDIYWADSGFEFCGDTVPVGGDCDDACIMIFNHFPDYFGLWDPLHVRVEVFDQSSTVVRWLIIPPRKTVLIRLSEWLPDRQGPACFYHGCYHPRLTGRRHSRWRSTAVYQWKKSAAMVHGAGDFRKTPTVNEFKLCCGLIESGEIVYTLPNYHQRLKEQDVSVDVLSGSRIETATRQRDSRIAEIKFDKDEDSKDEGHYGLRYPGNGGSFWFAFDEGRAGSSKTSLAANHTARSSIYSTVPDNPPDDAALQLQNRFKEHGILLDPHGLLVTPEDVQIEFGFEFDATVPSIMHFNLRLHSGNGEFLEETAYTKKSPGPLFASDILRTINRQDADVGLIVLDLDWFGEGANPIGRGAIGNLLARHKSTGDWDSTEFQNCWRNVGTRVGERPHWLSQDRMLVGRTNLLCGVYVPPPPQTARLWIFF